MHTKLRQSMLPPKSELIIRDNGAIYHLGIKPGQLAKTIITVGDPDRVNMVSKYFDQLEFTSQTREFVIHTGYLGHIRLSVLSTGIGTDNIDIVYNEADALFNIMGNPEVHQTLNFIRLGTSGTVNPDIPVDAFVVSQFSLGLDNLGIFYQRPNEAALNDMTLAWSEQLPDVPLLPYFDMAHEQLIPIFSSNLTHLGMTASCPGFYGPQGRQLRLAPQEWFPRVFDYQYRGMSITNLEMETSAMYRLGRLLNHRSISLNVILANRIKKSFTQRYPENVDELIRYALNQIKKHSSFFLESDRVSG